MPWECRTVEDQRREFAQAAMYCSNFSALCREYGITRRTGRKWVDRYEQQQPLTDRSRRPHTTPTRTPEETELLVLSVRAENPGWGARTIHSVLAKEGHKNLPCVKTVNNILHRYGCISPEESRKRQPFTRFEKDLCNVMWQTDFKGEFKMTDNHYCYPLTILDDHSRFSLKIAPRLSTANVVIPVFTEVFREYGMPDAILSDNGAQFAGFKKGYTQFERWLMDLDILPIHGRILHPQTQGKVERFHRTMKAEALRTTPANLEHAKQLLSDWRWRYNELRPHEALGMKPPAAVYRESKRQFFEPKPFLYDEGARLVKVNNWGYLRFGPIQLYLSETMKDTFLEIRPGDLDTFRVIYRNYQIAVVDAVDHVLLNRHIRKL